MKVRTIKPSWSSTPEKKERYADLNLRIIKELRKLPSDLTDIPKTVEVFNSNQIIFLEEYKKNGLNVKQALSVANVGDATYHSWMRRPGFAEVVEKIQECYIQAVLADGKTVAGWGIEILKDLHNGYKSGDTKSANALAQMAGHMLKATGNFDSTDGVKTPQVLIQINTGKEDKAVKTVEAVQAVAQSKTQNKTLESSPSGDDIQLNFNSNERKKSSLNLSELL